MIASDLRTLLEKLNQFCTKSLESSVGNCLQRSHYELTWEHLFSQFLDIPTCDVALIVAHYGLNTAHIRRALMKDLEILPIGNSGKPSFSPVLIGIIERAWSLATLVYRRQEICSGILFVSACEQMQRAVTNIALELRKIDTQKITTDLFTIIAKSSEQVVEAEVISAKGAPAEVLTKYCKDFTKEAAEGRIDQILGRDDEIRQIIDILSRRRKNNPILVGEAGVGKTAVIEGLALRITKGDVPDTLKNVQLWELDMGLLQAGASVKGEFEKRLKAVIDTAKKSAGKIILFIDEAHTLIGAGGSEGMGDAANLLKPALARGELRTCAATTWLEYRKYFEKDPALTRRFQPIKVEEPDEDTAFIMLQGIAESYESHHGVHITTEAIKAAVSLSHRYISGRQLPDKAVDVLDTACTRVKMSKTTTPAELDNAQRSLENTKRALKALVKDESVCIAVSQEEKALLEQKIKDLESTISDLNARWEFEKKSVLEIEEMQIAMKDHLKDRKEQMVEMQQKIGEKVVALETFQGENPMVFPFVTASLCSKVIADWTGIPIGSMVKNEALVLLQLEEQIGKRVIGQEEGVRLISDVIRGAKSAMANPDAPLGVFIFAGPSGVGKTECALAIADILFGGEKFTTIINMSEYQESHTVSQLKGSPPGYVGYGEGGILTEAVRQKPYSIVILDEVEKAHRDILNMFYQVFDKGFMRDGEGRDINFRNTIIVMTSNLGADTILDECSGPTRPEVNRLIEAIRQDLTKHFQPALLGRCKIIPFYALSAATLREVIILKLQKLAGRLKSTHNISFEYAPEFLDSIISQCATIESGARTIDAVIDQTLMPTISQTLLAQCGDSTKSYSSIKVTFAEEKGFSIIIE